MAPAAGIEATLGRVTLRMASSLDLGEVLGEITRGLARDLGAALARIWLIEPEDPKTLRLAASAGLSERLDGSRGRVPIGALKIGQIAETRSPLCTTKLSGDPRFPDQDWIRENGLASFAGYPLVYREELLGVLAMFARTELGAADLERLGVFAAQAAIAIENAALFARVDALMKRLEAENTYLREELEESRPTGIVGESAALRGVLDQLARVAPTTSTVLLLGETGTGKELFARAIHEGSPRRAGPLIKVAAKLTPRGPYVATSSRRRASCAFCTGQSGPKNTSTVRGARAARAASVSSAEASRSTASAGATTGGAAGRAHASA
jgi:transcriptional regulator with GAF, ATPase, and Fis domain